MTGRSMVTENVNIQVFQNSAKKPPRSMWVGMFRDQIIGPYFFVEDTIHQEIVLDMLINVAHTQVRHRQRNMFFFQLDGAPANLRR